MKMINVTPEYKPKYALPLYLQLFADSAGGSGEGEGGEGAAPGTGEGGPEEKSKGGGDTKTFTQEDVNKIISDRLAKERSKWEKEFQAKIDEAKTEAEKLAKMNAEQKAEYERQQREKELADREAKITQRELRATALETLAEKDLPKELAEILDYTNADSTNKSIEAVEKAFRSAVEAGVNERLKGNPPKGGGGGGNSAIPDAEKIKNIFNQR